MGSLVFQLFGRALGRISVICLSDVKAAPALCVRGAEWCKNPREDCWKNPNSSVGLLQLQISGVLENTCIRRLSSCTWKDVDFLSNSLCLCLLSCHSKPELSLIMLKWYLLYSLWTFLNNFKYIFACLVFVLHLSLMYKIDLCVLFNFPLQISSVFTSSKKIVTSAFFSLLQQN